jgi:BASS family bile acid:Na+ symporter
VSLFSILTVPFAVGWAVVHFMGKTAPDVSVAAIAIAMFLITTLPALIGTSIRMAAPDLAMWIDPGLV